MTYQETIPPVVCGNRLLHRTRVKLVCMFRSSAHPVTRREYASRATVTGRF
jgi:hypothetical protein